MKLKVWVDKNLLKKKKQKLNITSDITRLFSEDVAVKKISKTKVVILENKNENINN